MTNKKPEQKRPDEKVAGKSDFNPGNMAGKTAATNKDGPDESNAHSTSDGEDEAKNFNPGNMAGKTAGTSSKPE